MKKILLASLLSVMGATSAFAQVSQAGYLTDGSGAVVKSGSGLCWNTSATKVPNADCGDVIVQVKQENAPVKVATTPEVKQEVAQKRVIINAEVLFGFDSAKLSKAGEEVLVKEVVGINPTEVEIAGYTDTIGTQKYNLRLSQKRADAVKQFLVAKGIASEKIVAIGFGETNLVCAEKHPTKASKCAAQNRRVDIAAKYVK